MFLFINKILQNFQLKELLEREIKFITIIKDLIYYWLRFY